MLDQNLKVLKKNMCLVVIISLTLLSCNKGLTGKEYHEWISKLEHGLFQDIENEKFQISIQYKPLDYMIALEARAQKLTPELYETLKSNKNGLQYFNIKLKSKTGEAVFKTAIDNESEYYNRMSYFLNDFENDLYLVDGQDTLPCVLYHFERNFGALPENNISIAFKSQDFNEVSKELIIVDRALGFGLQKILFNKEDLAEIPNLKTRS